MFANLKDRKSSQWCNFPKLENDGARKLSQLPWELKLDDDSDCDVVS
jgi:hypothetical protein